jgi:hypothetical protein
MCCSRKLLATAAFSIEAALTRSLAMAEERKKGVQDCDLLDHGWRAPKNQVAAGTAGSPVSGLSDGETTSSQHSAIPSPVTASFTAVLSVIISVCPQAQTRQQSEMELEIQRLYSELETRAARAGAVPCWLDICPHTHWTGDPSWEPPRNHQSVRGKGCADGTPPDMPDTESTRFERRRRSSSCDTAAAAARFSARVSAKRGETMCDFSRWGFRANGGMQIGREDKIDQELEISKELLDSRQRAEQEKTRSL